MLAIRCIKLSIEVCEIVDENHRTVTGVLGRRVLFDRSVEVHDPVGSTLRPALDVQGQQVGKDDVDPGVFGPHLPDQDVVGADNFTGGLLADKHVVGSKEHEDDIWRIGI